jgi:hypothetical protein
MGIPLAHKGSGGSSAPNLEKKRGSRGVVPDQSKIPAKKLAATRRIGQNVPDLPLLDPFAESQSANMELVRRVQG